MSWARRKAGNPRRKPNRKLQLNELRGFGSKLSLQNLLQRFRESINNIRKHDLIFTVVCDKHRYRTTIPNVNHGNK